MSAAAAHAEPVSVPPAAAAADADVPAPAESAAAESDFGAPAADTAAVQYDLHVSHPVVTPEVQTSIDAFRKVSSTSSAAERSAPPPREVPAVTAVVGQPARRTVPRS